MQDGILQNFLNSPISDNFLERFVAKGRLSLDRLLSLFSAKDIMSRFSSDERLEGLSPDKRLEGLSLDERLEGLSPDEIQAYLQKARQTSNE